MEAEWDPRMPPICGKPVSYFPLGSRNGQPVPATGIVASTVCVLDPGHEGDCIDVKARRRARR